MERHLRWRCEAATAAREERRGEKTPPSSPKPSPTGPPPPLKLLPTVGQDQPTMWKRWRVKRKLEEEEGEMDDFLRSEEDIVEQGAPKLLTCTFCR